MHMNGKIYPYGKILSNNPALNKRGPWWNSGASHMNQAFDTSYFTNSAVGDVESNSSSYPIVVSVAYRAFTKIGFE